MNDQDDKSKLVSGDMQVSAGLIPNRVPDDESAFTKTDERNAPSVRFPIFIKILGSLLFFALIPSVIFILFLTYHYNQAIQDLSDKVAVGIDPDTLEYDIGVFLYHTRIRIGLVLVLFVAASVAAMYIASRTIAKPIGKIIEAMRRVGKGIYGTTVDVNTSDEIGIFAYYFNLMSYRLRLHRSREQWINKAKSNLLTLAAHQLRTPITAVRWTLEEVLNESFGPLTEEQKIRLQKGAQSTYRMINLINSLLTLTRIEEGRFGFFIRKESIVEVVKEVFYELEPLARQRGIVYNIHLPEKEIPYIYFDVEKIRFVLENLISNALHYTNRGGKVDVSVNLRSSGSKQEVLIEVKDTGIGMSKEELKKVFEQFSRSQRAVEMYQEGSGLGLFISKNIIAGHGGRIWVESELDKGTRFFFTLPVDKEDIPQDQFAKRFIVGS